MSCSPPPPHASFVDVRFIAYNKNPDNNNNKAPIPGTGTHRHSTYLPLVMTS